MNKKKIKGTSGINKRNMTKNKINKKISKDYEKD